jgi:hypothetical protein
MQTTRDVAALLSIPPASMRRIKKELGLIKDFHFVKEGQRLLWTPEGVDSLSAYVYDNPFAGLLRGDLWDVDEAA